MKLPQKSETESSAVSTVWRVSVTGHYLFTAADTNATTTGNSFQLSRRFIMPAEKEVDSTVYNNFFPNEGAGVLVEIGAARPDYLSIGSLFRDKGWRVISIEPNPIFASKHRELGHEIYEYACADADKEEVDFVIAEGKGLKYLGGEVTAESFSSLGIRGKYKDLLTEVQEKYTLRTIKVKVRRLDTILSYLKNVTRIHVIAVDVEGWELECLKGFSFATLAPKVAIIENLFHDPRYVDFMKSFGYELWRVLEPNDVYVLTSSGSA
jgi:FkbM family methyltransferase